MGWAFSHDVMIFRILLYYNQPLLSFPSAVEEICRPSIRFADPANGLNAFFAMASSSSVTVRARCNGRVLMTPPEVLFASPPPYPPPPPFAARS